MTVAARSTLDSLRREIVPRAVASVRKAESLIGAVALVDAAHALSQWAEEHHNLTPRDVEIVESFLLGFARSRILAAQNGELARIVPNG